MNENLKTSAQIAIESGLSKRRVNQFAKRFNIPKIGTLFVWDEEAEKLFYSRIGMRGHKLKD
jgi:hypothetical protein